MYSADPQRSAEILYELRVGSSILAKVYRDPNVLQKTLESPDATCASKTSCRRGQVAAPDHGRE